MLIDDLSMAVSALRASAANAPAPVPVPVPWAAPVPVPVPVPAPAPVRAPAGLVVVIDTNFLLSHTEWLGDLAARVQVAGADAVLLLPWVVLEELDALKVRHAHMDETND
jgi:hypothetical protein